MGIDYGLGTTNIDKATGIRYGVIPAGDVGQAWYDDSEPDYGEPHCPKCGNEASPYSEAMIAEDDDENWECSGCRDFACFNCKYAFDSSEAYNDEACGFDYITDEYVCHQSGDDCDIFVIKSPFYTFAPFCSPCAPGACYLRNGSMEGDAKAYCFGHDWFEGGKAPYPVFRVSDDSLVESESGYER